MGRLTLNMLLSFAQFEREVAGERIRDKIAASKRKGMWMGGNVPLGYDVRDRKLVVNEAEASIIGRMFRLYADLGSVRALGERLAADGVVGKSGAPLSRGALFYILQNRIYLGEIAHKGNSYPGEHPALIDVELWQAVQRQLAGNRNDRVVGANAANPSLLAGLMFDAAGQSMTATHANKAGQRYRYYVSRDLILGARAASEQGLRIPAPAIERMVSEHICQFLRDDVAMLAALRDTGALPSAAPEQARLLADAAQLAQRWCSLGASEQRSVLAIVLRRIDISRQLVTLHLVPAALPFAVRGQQTPTDFPAATLRLSIPMELRRTGKEMALVVGAQGRPVDAVLVRLVSKARSLRDELVARPDQSLTAMAAGQGVSVSYASRLIRLAWLAPDIVEAILAGRQPHDLTATRLMRESNIPHKWQAQRDALGCL